MSAPVKAPEKTGRGGLAVLFAKVYFIVVGLIQQVALKALLGLEGYGALSTALSTSSIVYNPITQASIQGVSREFAGSDQETAPSVFRALLRIHALAALLFGGAFYLASGPVSTLLGAPHIRTSLRILGVVLFTYGLYTPLVGALNGQKRFVSQAGLDILATTLRTLGLLAGAYFVMGSGSSSGASGASGALMGFAASSFVVLATAAFITGIGKGGASPLSPKRYLAILVPIFGGQFVLNLLFQADALLLRRFAADAARLAGLDAVAADPIVGAYRGAQLFCFLPYQLLMSLTLILFPLLATAKKTGNDGEVRELLGAGIRLATIVAGLFVSVLVAVPGPLLKLLFGPEAALLGANAMRILSVGLGAFAVLGVITTAQNSLGAERASLKIIGLGFLLVVALCFAFTRNVPLGEGLLVRTSLATSIALSLATLVAAYSLSSLAGPVFSGKSTIKVLLALALAGGTGTFLHPRGALLTLVATVLPAAVYVGSLIALRELTATDLHRARQFAGRRSAKS